MSRAAVIQMISTPVVKENLQSLNVLFLQAKEAGADLLVLPENFAFMGMADQDKINIAETYGEGEIQEKVSQLAEHYGLWVIAGTLPLKCSKKKVTASCLVFDEKGRTAARYDKIHLFDVRLSENEVYQESLTIEPGDAVVVVDTPVGCVGLSICYDLRFPELYRQLVLKGAEIFSIPSAFTAVTGLLHWETLLRARAIENLCYVLASNQGGLHGNGRHTYGHSVIIEPWGTILAEQPIDAGVVVADIDLKRLQTLRRQFPCNEHHLPHLSL